MTATSTYTCGHTRETETRACYTCRKRQDARRYYAATPPRACASCGRAISADYEYCRSCGMLRRWHGTVDLKKRNAVLLEVETQPLPQIAKKLGIAPDYARQLVRARHGVPRSQLLRRGAGMTPEDVALALGLPLARVRYWLCYDVMPSVKPADAPFRSIDPNALYDWLASGSALLPDLVPTGEWAIHVQTLRADLARQWIERTELCAALHISLGALNHRMRANGFPSFIWRHRKSGRAYHERAAVAAWLDAHPDSWTAAARDALYYEGGYPR